MAHEIFLVLKSILHIHPSYQVPISVDANLNIILLLRTTKVACKAPEETGKHPTRVTGADDFLVKLKGRVSVIPRDGRHPW